MHYLTFYPLHNFNFFNFLRREAVEFISKFVDFFFALILNTILFS